MLRRLARSASSAFSSGCDAVNDLHNLRKCITEVKEKKKFARAEPGPWLLRSIPLQAEGFRSFTFTVMRRGKRRSGGNSRFVCSLQDGCWRRGSWRIHFKAALGLLYGGVEGAKDQRVKTCKTMHCKPTIRFAPVPSASKNWASGPQEVRLQKLFSNHLLMHLILNITASLSRSRQVVEFS